MRSKLFTAALALLLALTLLTPAIAATTTVTRPPAQQETWSEWTVTKKPTCTQPGQRTRKSSLGKVQTETIPATGHKYGAWKISSPATCVERAKEEHRCTVCGNRQWQWTGELGDHQWGEWVVVREPDYYQNGLRQRVCSVCGKTEEEEFTGGASKVLPEHMEEDELPSITLEAVLTAPGPFWTGNDPVIFLTVTNHAKVPLTDMNSNACPDEEWPETLAPEESRTVPLTFTIIQPFIDAAAANGGLYTHQFYVVYKDELQRPAVGDTILDIPIEEPEPEPEPEPKPEPEPEPKTEPAEKPEPLPEAEPPAILLTASLAEPGPFHEEDAPLVHLTLVNLSGEALFYVGSDGSPNEGWPILLHPYQSVPLSKNYPLSGVNWAEVEANGNVCVNTISVSYENTDSVACSVTAVIEIPMEKGANALSLELVAINLDTAGAPYSADDVVSIQATVRNNGTLPLDETIIYNPYGEPEAHTYSQLLPEQTFTKTFQYTVTQEDVDDGGVSFEIEAVGWAVDGSEVTEVWALPVEINLATGKASDDHPHMTLTAVPAPYGALDLNSCVTIQMTLLNDGNRSVRADKFYDSPVEHSYQDITTGFSTYEWATFDPGMNGSFNVFVIVTQKDVDEGKVIRDFSVDYTWLKNAEEAYPYTTEPVHFEIQLDETQPKDAKLTLTSGAVSVGEALPGQPVQADMTLTNTGKLPVEFKGIMIEAYDGDESAAAFESFDVWNAYIDTVLQPGDSINVTHTTHIVPPDIGKGHVSRKLQVRGQAIQEEEKASGELLSNWEPFDIVLKPDETDPVLITKTIISSSFLPEGYTADEQIQYVVTVQNISDDDVTSVRVTDPLYSDNAEHLLAEYDILKPLETVTALFAYTVTAEDVQNADFIYNIATAEYTYALDGLTYVTASPSVAAPLYKAKEPHSLSLSKSYVFDPDNGVGFTPGEKITFKVTVTNPNDVALTNVSVYDALAWETSTTIKTYPTLPAHASDTVSFEYTVTEADVHPTFGYIVNTANAQGYAGADKVTAISNAVKVPVSPPEGRPELKIDKNEISHPTHDGKYFIDEWIDYEITVTNTGDKAITNIKVSDSLKTTDGGVLGTIAVLMPAESQTFHFSHQVDAPDIDQGEVYNYATAEYVWLRIDRIIITRTVITPVGEGPKPHDGIGADSCVRTLTQKGDVRTVYTLERCAEHEAVAVAAQSLIEAASTDAERLEAYQQANALWADAIQLIYQDLLIVYPQYSHLIVGSQAAWNQYVRLYEAGVTEGCGLSPLETAQKINQQLITRCVDLCYALHHAGETEHPDSMITGHYTTIHASPVTNCETALFPSQAGPLRLRQMLCSEHMVIDQMTLNNISGQSHQLAAVLSLTENCWRTAISGQVAAHRTTATDEGLTALADWRAAANLLLDADDALWYALWMYTPEYAAERLLTEARELAMTFCEP